MEEVKKEREEKLPLLRKKRQAEEEEEEDDGDYISCPLGTLYCLAMDSCVVSCGGEGGGEQMEEGDEEMPSFSSFMQGGWEEDEDGEEGEYQVCQLGQVFCMEVMACVSNCGFFEDDDEYGEEEEWGLEFSPEEEEDLCPLDMVYCMESRRCVPSALSCQEALEEEDTQKVRDVAMV